VRRCLLVLLLVTGCADPSSPRATSERITYRVVTGSVTTTAVTDVMRPYRARTLTHEGSGKGTGFAWDERALYTLAADGTKQTQLVGPGFAGPDSGLEVALPVAQRQGLVNALGTGSVLGRDCTRWLSELPLDGAPLSHPRPGDSTDSCVDAEGRVLSDTWRVDGKVVRTRTATEVTSGPDLSGNALYGGSEPTPLPTALATVVVTESTTEELGRLLQVTAPVAPAGLRADTAAAVLDRDATGGGFAREAAVFTWTSSEHLAVLRVERDLVPGQGRTVRGAEVDLGGLGTGRLEPVLAGLRATVSGPRGLRIIATADLPEDAFLAWVRSLSF
jgi:hypothetical protein